MSVFNVDSINYPTQTILIIHERGTTMRRGRESLVIKLKSEVIVINVSFLTARTRFRPRPNSILVILNNNNSSCRQFASRQCYCRFTNGWPEAKSLQCKLNRGKKHHMTDSPNRESTFSTSYDSFRPFKWYGYSQKIIKNNYKMCSYL